EHRGLGPAVLLLEEKGARRRRVGDGGAAQSDLMVGGDGLLLGLGRLVLRDLALGAGALAGAVRRPVAPRLGAQGKRSENDQQEGEKSHSDQSVCGVSAV